MGMSSMFMAAAKSLIVTYPEFVLAFCCFAFFFCYQQIFRRSRGMPVNWPVVGMLPGIFRQLRRLHDWAVDLTRENACTFEFRGPWFTGMNYLCTSDPANVQHIFNVNFANYPKGEEFLQIFDILGDGIFNSDGESWKKQRIRAHNLMSSRRFRAFVAGSARSKVEKGLLPLVEQMAQRGAAFDLQNVFLRLTFDTTCYLVFGVDPCCLSIEFPTVPFAKAMDDAMGALLLRHAVPLAWWKLMKRLRIGEEKKLAMAREEIDRFIAQIIAEKKKLRKQRNHEDEGDEERADLLSSYINDDDEDHYQATDGDGEESIKYDKFLRDTAVNFMLAGRDTTGTALTWFFWLLSKNPEVESKIFEELKAASLTKARSSLDNELIMFDAEELGKLVYLHAALCESLRLFPSVPFEHKAAVQPEVLPSGHKVEAGTKILMSAYCIARMEVIWGKECMEFRPERWISEKGRLRHEPSYKFLSFNSGPRTCLGKEVAFTQMKAVVAAMVYNFHIEVVEGHVVAPKLSIILQMKNGLLVKTKRRVGKRG